MNANVVKDRSPVKFFILIVVLAIPFWILGAAAEQLAERLPINLPISALMFVCPLIAVAILVRGEDQQKGIKEMLRRTLDYKRIKNKIWYFPIVFLTPVALLVSYVIMRLAGMPLPVPDIPILAIPIFFILFFISAVFEEAGWTWYIAEPMQKRYSALMTGIIIGLVWGVWHAIPYFQAHNDFAWIVFQILTSVLNRILMVWIYNNTGKSMFGSIVYHDMINVGAFLFPNFGSHYSPAVTSLVLGIAVLVIVVVWGPKTLAGRARIGK